MNSGEKDREIPHVDAVFLLEMNRQLFNPERPVDERRPGPVMLAIHDAQDLFLEPALH